MRDLLDEVIAAHRDVSRRGSGDEEQLAVAVRRRYEAAVPDVWDAVTDPERLRRWFAPVTGEFRVGGTFQVEGNASGEVRECDPPHALTVSWGGPESVVRVRLSADGAATVLELEHSVPVAFAGSGAGALYVGPGWDAAVLGLGLYLRGEHVDDPAAWENSPEVQRFSAAAIDAWVQAVGTTATGDEVTAAAEAARAQFCPDVPAPQVDPAG
jgi:uncharacterized protein YndB with AHSA1/START domain